MTKSTFIRAFAVSTVFSFLFLFVAILMVSDATVFDTPIDPAEFYQRSYEEQQVWLAEHARQLTTLELVRSYMFDQWFWNQFIVQFGILFLGMFLACCVTVWWERCTNSPRTPHDPTL